MAEHHLTGKSGEELAVAFLKRNQFDILHTNWRHSHYEIDIIACKTGVLHFIEVKTRRSLKYGYPEEAVTEKKMENLIAGAEAYLLQFSQWQKIQFDILSVQLFKDQRPQYYLFEDVYL